MTKQKGAEAIYICRKDKSSTNIKVHSLVKDGRVRRNVAELQSVETGFFLDTFITFMSQTVNQ